MQSGDTEPLYGYDNVEQQQPVTISPTPYYDNSGRNSSQQIRRDSRIRDIPSRRSSQQSIEQPFELQKSYEIDSDKYTKDSVETEKQKSARASPIDFPVRRRSSIRFSDEIPLQTVTEPQQPQYTEQFEQPLPQQQRQSSLETDIPTSFTQDGYAVQGSLDTYQQPTTTATEYYSTEPQQYTSDYNIGYTDQQQQPNYGQQSDHNVGQIEQQYTTTQYDTSQYEPVRTEPVQQQYEPPQQTYRRRSSQQFSPNQFSPKQSFSPEQQYSISQQYQPVQQYQSSEQYEPSTAGYQQQQQQQPQYSYTPSQQYSSTGYETSYTTDDKPMQYQYEQQPIQRTPQQQYQQQPSSLSSTSESLSGNSNLGSKRAGNGQQQKPRPLQKQLSKKKM